MDGACDGGCRSKCWQESDPGPSGSAAASASGAHRLNMAGQERDVGSLDGPE